MIPVCGAVCKFVYVCYLFVINVCDVFVVAFVVVLLLVVMCFCDVMCVCVEMLWFVIVLFCCIVLRCVCVLCSCVIGLRLGVSGMCVLLFVVVVLFGLTWCDSGMCCCS